MVQKWLVETRYFSLGEQYYSTAGVNWTRMAKQLFRRSWYRNGQCSRSNGRISMRLWQTEAVVCIFGSWKYQVWENYVARVMWLLHFEQSWKKIKMSKIHGFSSKSCIIELSETCGAISCGQVRPHHRDVWHAEWFSSLLASRAVTMVDGLPRAASLACRVVRTLSTYSKSNTLAEAGAIERQLVLRLFINFCHKNGDIFLDSLAIVMKVVVHQE